MIYNPYLYLPRFASINVLADEDPHADIYVLYECYVYAGASTASAWLANGKPHSKEQAIAATMDEALPYTEQMPFPASDAQRLVQRGFDWLLQFDLAADAGSVPLKALPIAQQHAASMDAERYRAFIGAGYPITFLGTDYRDKASLDAAIDAFMQEERRERSS